MFWDGERWVLEPSPSNRGQRLRLRRWVGTVSILVLIGAALVLPALGAHGFGIGATDAQPGSRAAIASTPPTRTSEPATVKPKGRAPLVGVPRNARPARNTNPAASPAPARSKLSASSGLVKQSGTRLMLSGQPYRFTGMNIYMAASGGTPSSCGGALYPDVGVPLSRMPKGTVVRFWAFQNFFVSKRSFDWTNFDRVLRIAAAHGDKVIPVLANQLDYCDGAGKDLSWYQRGYRFSIRSGDRVSYRDYVEAVVARYAGNPTIAMWQLVNEGEARNSNGTCDESAALGALLAFSKDVGGLAHRLDPGHLVSLGVLAGWAGGGQGQWCGASNADYRTLDGIARQRCLRLSRLRIPNAADGQALRPQPRLGDSDVPRRQQAHHRGGDGDLRR